MSTIRLQGKASLLSILLPTLGVYKRFPVNIGSVSINVAG